MRFLRHLPILMGALFGASSLAEATSDDSDISEPTVARAGTVNDIVITKDNTFNATASGPPPANYRIAATPNLPLALANFIRAGPVTVYVSANDTTGRLVFLKPDGTWYYPTAQVGNTTPQEITDDIGIPLGGYGTTKQVTLPSYFNSGRIWFSIGSGLKFYVLQPNGAAGPTLVQPAAENPSDPNSEVRWSFVEMTNTEDGLYANLSFVDFVGIVAGMALKTTDGRTLSVPGLRPASLVPICNAMKNQSTTDGQPWGRMCMVDGSGKVLRVLNPTKYLGTSGPKFNNYFPPYINAVFKKYTTSTLTIDTQLPDVGSVACRVTNGLLGCDRSDKTYGKPNAVDIFGCASGPFSIAGNAVHQAIVPRLCAAFNRATLLQSGGNVQPGPAASTYYTATPNNQYSRIVHSFEIEGRGYAFPYDDVNPTGTPDQSGTLSDGSPALLTLYIGGKQ